MLHKLTNDTSVIFGVFQGEEASNDVSCQKKFTWPCEIKMAARLDISFSSAKQFNELPGDFFFFDCVRFRF